MTSTTTTATTTRTTTNIIHDTSQRAQYPAGVPSKFSPDGVVQTFPGNTTLCHLPRESPLIPALQHLYEAVQAHPLLSKRVHLLPPASWHMTVLDGVRDQDRAPGEWPAGKENQDLSECTEEFSRELRKAGLDLEKEGLAPPYKMRVRGFDPALTGIGLEVEGATAEEEKRMRRLRDKLAAAMGFKAVNHEEYIFHVSVAYQLRHIDGEERVELDRFFAEQLPRLMMEFDLGHVEYCTFDSMYEFPRVFYLGEA